MASKEIPDRIRIYVDPFRITKGKNALLMPRRSKHQGGSLPVPAPEQE